MAVKTSRDDFSQNRRPAAGWKQRAVQALTGISLVCVALATPFLAARENSAALSVAELESYEAPVEVFQASPLSFQGRSALLETCIKMLTSLRYTLLPEDEKAQVTAACSSVSDLNSGLSEAGILRAHLALQRGNSAEAAQDLITSQEAAPWDGWLAFQRVRAFLDLHLENPDNRSAALALQDDLTVLLAGTQYLEALGRDLIRRPDLRQSLFPALQELGPESTEKFLAAYYRAKDPN